MTDPFVAAARALFEAPGSKAAIHFSADGAATPIRVIPTSPDITIPGEQRVLIGAHAFEIMIEDVPGLMGTTPDTGQCDMLSLGAAFPDDALAEGTLYELLGEPVRDVEGITWAIGADLARR